MSGFLWREARRPTAMTYGGVPPHVQTPFVETAQLIETIQNQKNEA
jgi:hypothetical protein